MQFFSVGQFAEGFIAIGQEATGVIAIGQMATGVIAIGQLARGVFTVGMLSIGVVSVGMLSIGLVHCISMIGAGGRGFGGVVPLVPKLPDSFDLPPVVSPAEIETGQKPGWVRGIIANTAQGLALVAGGRPLRVRIGQNASRAANQALRTALPVLANVVPSGGGAEVVRLMRDPGPSARDPRWLGLAAAQLVGLVIATTIYFWFGLAPVVDGVMRVFKD